MKRSNLVDEPSNVDMRYLLRDKIWRIGLIFEASTNVFSIRVIA